MHFGKHFLVVTAGLVVGKGKLEGIKICKIPYGTTGGMVLGAKTLTRHQQGLDINVEKGILLIRDTYLKVCFQCYKSMKYIGSGIFITVQK